MLFDHPLDLLQFPPVKAVIGREVDRVEPEFGFIVTGFDVDMNWLLPLVAEEEKAKRPTRRTVGIGKLVRWLPCLHHAFPIVAMS